MKNENKMLFQGFCILFLFITNIAVCQTQNLKDGYYLGAFNEAYRIYNVSNDAPIWGYFNDMNFNINHEYGFHGDNDGSNKIGGFYDDPSAYMINVGPKINWSYQNGQKLFLWRMKPNKAAYGQRSTYQAEEYDGNNIKWIDKRPGYGYEYHGGGDYYEFFNNEYVRGRTSDGLPIGTEVCLVSGLYEKCEQTDHPKTAPGDDELFSDNKSSTFRWYIKPRMRIDPLEGGNINKDVVKIEIYAYDGNIIGTPITLKVIDFYDKNGNFDDKYREIFYEWSNPNPLSYPLSVLGSDLNRNNLGGVYNSNVDYKLFGFFVVKSF